MKLIEFEKIILPSGNIEKIYPNKKFNFTLQEIYIVNIKGKKKKEWRRHLNAKKVLRCIKGSVLVYMYYKRKIKTFILNQNDNQILIINKKTKFRFCGASIKMNSLLVISDTLNKKIVTTKYS